MPALIEDTRHTENFLDRQRFLQFQLRQRLMQDLQQMPLQVDALFAIRQNEVPEEVD